MKFSKDQIKNELKEASEKCKKNNIHFGINDIGELLGTLDSLSGKYNENTRVSKKDLSLIGVSVKKALESMTKHTLDSMKNGNTVAKPVERVMIAADYLYLLCMDNLGCPRMRIGFNDDVEKTMTESAIAMHKARGRYNVSKEQAFKAQRGLDVVDLKAAGIDKLIETVSKGKATETQTGTLLAEYQALRERQRRHSAIWRWFHSKENQARNDLMNQMKNTLERVLGPNVKIETEDPAVVCEQIANKKIYDNIEKALTNRFNQQQEEYAIADSLKDMNVNNNVRESIIINDDFSLFNDESNIKHETAPPVFEEPKHSTEIDAINNGFNLIK